MTESTWTHLERAIQTHPAVGALLGGLALTAVTLLVIVARRAHRRSKLTAEQTITLLAAAIATGVSAQGMYTFFRQVLGLPVPLTAMFFAFLEVMVISSALRARASMRQTGSAGVDGIAMWVLTCLSGILAATDAHNLGTLLIRLTAPLVAAWGWERSMALERKMSGEAISGLNWRISPQRLLVQWGLADPTDRSAAEVAIERRLADLARAADAVRASRETDSNPRRQRRALQKLQTAIDRASEDGVVLGDPDVRDRLRQHLEGRFAAYSLPEYQPATDWAAPNASPATAELPAPATRDLFDELEREFGSRAALEPARGARAEDGPAPIARAADRAPRAEIDVPRAIEDRASIARGERPARAEDEADRDRAPRAEQEAGDESRAAHMPSDLVSDRAPIAAREQDQTLMDSLDGSSARDRRAVVSIVRPSDPARGARAGQAPRASDAEVDGALARAADRAPRAEDGARVTGLYARTITRADAEKLARAVIQQRLSKQPVEVLVLIYEAVGQGQNPTSIGKELVQLPHATVIRAIKAAESVAGPRPID